MNDGVAIAAIENEEHKTYLEMVRSTECKFLVLAGETGGRWSPTCCKLIRDLAWAKGR